MKEEIKNPENAVEYTISKQWKHIVSVVGKILEVLVSKELSKID